jgi:hypothetical protein
MALQNNPIAPSANGAYPSYTSNAAPAPTANTPTAINTVDQFQGAQEAPITGPMPTSLTGGILGKLGIGHLVGAVGGALLGARVILPRLAVRLAPKVPPSMWLKFGVIGGSALAGAWLLGKLFGGSKAAASLPVQQG